MECPKCHEQINMRIKPVVFNMRFEDAGSELRAVGLVNNREFVFFTDDDRREWWYEMSLDPFIGYQMCNKGDGVWWSTTNVWPKDAPKAMDAEVVNRIIRAIIKNLVKSGMLDKDNYDSFNDRIDEEGFEPKGE